MDKKTSFSKGLRSIEIVGSILGLWDRIPKGWKAVIQGALTLASTTLIAWGAKVLGLIGEFWPFAIFGAVTGLVLWPISSLGLRSRLRALEEGNTGLGSKVVVRGGVFELADPEAAVIPDSTDSEPPLSPPLTESEKVCVDELRVVYESDAKWALEAIVTVLGETQNAIAVDNVLAPLMSEAVKDIAGWRDAMPLVLRDDNTDGFPEITASVSRFFRAYMRAVRVFHLAAGDPAYRKASQERVHEEWKPAHRQFQESFKRVLHRSSLAGLKEEVDRIGWDERWI